MACYTSTSFVKLYCIFKPPKLRITVVYLSIPPVKQNVRTGGKISSALRSCNSPIISRNSSRNTCFKGLYRYLLTLLTVSVHWHDVQVRAFVAPEACQHCRDFGEDSTAGLACWRVWQVVQQLYWLNSHASSGQSIRNAHKSFSSDFLPSLVPTNCGLVELLFRMSFSSNLNHYGMVHVASVSDVLLDNSFTPPCQRMGGMVSFRTFEDFVRYVGKGDDCLCCQLPRWAQMELDKIIALSRVRFKLILGLFAEFLEFRVEVCLDLLVCLLEITESFRLL